MLLLLLLLLLLLNEFATLSTLLNEFATLSTFELTRILHTFCLANDERQ